MAQTLDQTPRRPAEDAVGEDDVPRVGDPERWSTSTASRALLDLLLHWPHQRWDLRASPVLALSEQYLAFVERCGDAAGTGRGLLVMGSVAGLLKSKLLIPKQRAGGRESAEMPRCAVPPARLEALRERRPGWSTATLGRELFARAMPEMVIVKTQRFLATLYDLPAPFRAAQRRPTNVLIAKLGVWSSRKRAPF